MLGTLGYTDGKVLGSEEGIKLELSCVEVLVIILGHIYGSTLDLDVGTELGSLYISLDGSNDGNLEVFFIGI